MAQHRQQHRSVTPSHSQLPGGTMTALHIPTSPVYEEMVSQQAGRALIGWLSDQEAIHLLLGRQPLPTDDLRLLMRTVVDSKAAVAARPIFAPTNPIMDGTTDSRLMAIKERPEVQAAFAGMNWRPAKVNLRDVLAIQKTIKTEGLEARIDPVRKNRGQLLDLCLPTVQAVPPAGANLDHDGKGFTMISANPNLRIAGVQLHPASVSLSPGAPAVQMPAVTVCITMATSYLQTVEYKGRYFLRDGYHRAAGLLRAGIEVVPCIFIEAENFQQVVGQPGLFDYETLFGDQPPHLSDFWENAVAHDISQIAQRKVIRIRGDEFNVQG